MNRWLKSPKIVALLAGVVAVLAGGSALVAQEALEGPRPTPDDAALAELTQVVKYYEETGQTPEPPFLGEMNGFQFQNFPPEDSVCKSPRDVFAYGTDKSTALDVAPNLTFDATYVPAGFETQVQRFQDSERTGDVQIVQCPGDAGPIVVSAGQRWSSSAGTLSIERRTGPSVISAHYTESQLEPTTINGLPAILVEARFPGDSSAPAIYMRDDHSSWQIISEGLSLEELKKVAEGLR